MSKHLGGAMDCRRGFTLLEVMIAVAVLAITLTVLYGSQTQSLSLAAEAKFNTKATYLAGLKIAELESGLAALENDEGDFGETFPNFQWKIEVDEVDLSDSEILVDLEEALVRVTLTIAWEGSPYSHSVDYYLPDRGGP